MRRVDGDYNKDLTSSNMEARLRMVNYLFFLHSLAVAIPPRWVDRGDPVQKKTWRLLSE